MWQSLGDELVFYSKLSNSDQAAYLTLCFIKAIKSYTNYFKEKDLPLSIKGTAWLSGFPVMNAEIKSNDKSDFIGPSIDIGFRLTKFSTEKKFIISCDLACFLTAKNVPIEYHYDGKKSLKGVINDNSYPIIWIECKQSETKNTEDELYGQCDNQNLLKFCKTFIQENEEFMIFPFIEGDSMFGEEPEGYDKKYESITSRLKDQAIDDSGGSS